ncbi:hypothetical protein A6R68_18192 [Neotoma lepida]|uniref:Uncharacterized protein n=1 Tax=Neotoma lepida TaxID=56216 RepID=A0A1A6HMC4_NEOLE|nr:hypothetical protein A6R68_18192 [Neotoma lepida]
MWDGLFSIGNPGIADFHHYVQLTLSTKQSETPDQAAAPDTTDREPTRPASSQEPQAGEQTSARETGPRSSRVDRESRGTHVTWSLLGRVSVGVQSTLKRKEDPADPGVPQRNLQFVGVNGGYESSSEDSSTAENSEHESTENEAPEPPARVLSTAECPQLRPPGTAVAKASLEESQLPQEAQRVPAAEAASRPSSEEEIRMDLSPDLISACLALEKYLENPNALTERELKVAYTTVLQEWLRLACRSDAHPELVRRHLVTFRAMSARLLDYVVNIADSNGNTALHYSVSHANFPVVRQLLDSGVCQVDKLNRAGYSPIMLTALATLKTQDDIETILQLFRLGNVNAKASQAGQTALMLAVSHGRVDVVKALLTCEVDVNIQDEDGSTALMCACEHGHKEITGLLLAVPNCDISLTDRTMRARHRPQLKSKHRERPMTPQGPSSHTGKPSCPSSLSALRFLSLPLQGKPPPLLLGSPDIYRLQLHKAFPSTLGSKPHSKLKANLHSPPSWRQLLTPGCKQL